MSGRAETEMQIQIMTHGEAFCPSTMTKEFLSKNQIRMMVTNIMRNEMQKGPTEGNEIKEGQEKVEEELGNEKKESTFSSPWKFCRNLLNEERGQMDENKIKEGQEEEQEEQGNMLVMFRSRAYIYSAVLSSWRYGILEYIERYGILEYIERIMNIYKKERSLSSYSHSGIYTLWSHVSSMETRYKISKFKQAIEEMEIRRLEIENFERKQSNEEMKIRRLEIENFWKHALGKDMNIMRILKSGSLRFLKQQIQDVWQLLRCKVCLDNEACMVFFPCRHMATCEYCGSFLDQCPVCRTFIEKTVKVNKK